MGRPDRDVNDDALVGLTKHHRKMDHVLMTVTEGRGTDSCSGPVKKAIMDLERCVDLPWPSLLVITSNLSVQPRV